MYLINFLASTPSIQGWCNEFLKWLALIWTRSRFAAKRCHGLLLIYVKLPIYTKTRGESKTRVRLQRSLVYRDRQ